jgi:hypothetical protein
MIYFGDTGGAMKNKITRSAVFSAIGKTWFDLTEEDGRMDLETRMHGDVGEAIAGDEDKKEGMRLLSALRKAFPESDYETDFNIIDEWVSVSIRVEPLNETERAVLAKAAKVEALNAKLREATEAVNEAAKAEGLNLRGPVSFYVSTGSSYFPDKVEVKVEFGKRFLYTNHLGAGIKFATAAEAEAAGREILKAFPKVEWAVNVGKLTDRTTYNKPAPYNVIETTGTVLFAAPLTAFVN